MANLNWVDYIFLAIFLFSILGGLSRGFVKEVISFAALIAAFIIAALFSQHLANVFTSSSSVQNVVSQASSAIGTSAAKPVSYLALGLSFAILFAGTIIAGSIISYFINVAFQTGVLGVGNRLLGGVFGLCRGFLINLVIIFLVQLTPFSDAASWRQSQIVSSYQPAVQWLAGIVSPSLANLKEKIGQTLQNVNSQIQNLTNTYGNFGK